MRVNHSFREIGSAGSRGLGEEGGGVAEGHVTGVSSLPHAVRAYVERQRSAGNDVVMMTGDHVVSCSKGGSETWGTKSAGRGGGRQGECKGRRRKR